MRKFRENYIEPERARLNLKHLRAMIDEYIEFAVREEIPDLMTPLLHMDRDLVRLAAILEAWCAASARERADARGNR